MTASNPTRAKPRRRRSPLHFDADPQAPDRYLGDPLRVRQIVANLLSNAHQVHRKRLGVPALLRIRPRLAQIEMCIEVSDTGAGIAADKLTADLRKVHAGRRQHYAQIRRHRARPGHHATPGGNARRQDAGRKQGREGEHLYRDSSLGTRDEGRAGSAPAPPRQRAEVVPAPDAVLLVEDNLVNQKVVLAILRKKGFQIDVANDGREALSKLEAAAGPYDLVLMDVQMPVLDGLETTRIIRKNPALGPAPHRRHDRPRHERRPRTLPASRHERLHLEAGAARAPGVRHREALAGMGRRAASRPRR